MLLDPLVLRLQRLKCAVITGARLLSQDMRRGGFRSAPWMVTLTYRPGVEWQPGHITGAVKAAREYFRRAGVPWRCIWVAELQERGAVHYHVLIWLPVGRSMPKWDKRGWWRHGLTRTERVRNAVGYAAKYVSKGDGRPFPKGCRTYAIAGLGVESRRIAAWWRLPGWVRERWGSHEVRRASGSVLHLGRKIISPYRVVCRSGEGGQRWLDLVKLDCEPVITNGPSSALHDVVITATGEVRRTRTYSSVWGVTNEYRYRVAQEAWDMRCAYQRASWGERLRFWFNAGGE